MDCFRNYLLLHCLRDILEDLDHMNMFMQGEFVCPHLAQAKVEGVSEDV